MFGKSSLSCDPHKFVLIGTVRSLEDVVATTLSFRVVLLLK